MKDVRDNVFSFLDDWYGRLDDIIEDLKNNGFAVLNATNEFIDVSDENDKEYVLKLGGTEKTITINKIEALDESLIPIQEYYDEDLEESAKVTNESNLDSLSNVSEGNSSDSKTIEIVTEKDTFGDYKENVFTALDNIDALISSYQEVNKDSLKELIAALEEELDIIQKIYMKLATGIEQEIL